MTRSATSRKILAAALAVATVVLLQPVAPAPSAAETDSPSEEKMPLDGPFQYDVEYLGLTCGHVTLESRREEFEGRDTYHIIMRAWTSPFFNRIYKVDGRIDSWTDAETLNGLVYESVITEKGKTSTQRYRVDQANRQVIKNDDGKIKTIPFEGEAGLDPLAFLFRARFLADEPGRSFHLQLLTDDGPLKTMSEVGPLKRRYTRQGSRGLVSIEPLPASGEMFSRKGRFVMWVDPAAERTLYRFYFKLGFGRLSAELEGPAEPRDPPATPSPSD